MRRLAAIVLVPPLLALVWACGAPPGETPAKTPAWFEEAATPSGLVFDHRSGHDGRRLFPEIMGGGAALFDMDGDGDLDAYLVQSGSLLAPGGEDTGNRLLRNEGAGRFVDVTEGSGAGDRGYGMGVAVGDFDDDGDPDLYVTNYGPNVLLRNDGGGKFTDVGARAGVGHPGWSTSAAFVDYDADGDLDLYVANYVNWSPRVELECYSDSGLPDYCLPTNYNAPAADALYRNDGAGAFTDVTAEAGLLAAFGNGLGVVCADFDLDGRADVFVANDMTLDQLWINRGAAGFADEALLRGCALDEHGSAKAGMGVVAQDVDDDGDEDLLVVNLESQTDSFFRNDAGYFSDRTGELGLGTVGRRFTRFGVGLHDFDNDGWLDLYVANGRVTLLAEPPGDDPYAEENLLFRGTPSGRFEEVRPRGGTAEPLLGTSRGAAFGDVDGDGGVDVLVVNRDGPAHLLRNRAPGRGAWIRFRVLERSGRDALGATLVAEVGARRLTRVVRSAYSYCSSSDPAVHLGLGAIGKVERVSVRWVDGSVEGFGEYEAGRVVELRRGSGQAEPR